MSTAAKTQPIFPVAVDRESAEAGSGFTANQRLSRYRYASLFAENKSVLDVSCGSGSGTELLARYSARVFGCDESAEMITDAGVIVALRARLLRCSEAALPIAKQSLDLVTAFEISHAGLNWSRLTLEAARILAEDGVFLASLALDPRGDSSSQHEAWRRLLATHFPFIILLSQGSSDGSLVAESPLAGSLAFMAVCSKREVAIPLPGRMPIVLPLLRDRELHLPSLQPQSLQLQSLKDELQEARTFNAALSQKNHELTEANNEQSRWADRLNSALGSTQATLRVRDLQVEMLECELLSSKQEIDVLLREHDELRRKQDELRREQSEIRGSIWLQLGNIIGLGPGGQGSPLRSLGCSIKARTLLSWAQFKPFSPLAPHFQTSRKVLGRIGLYCLSPILLLFSCLVIAAVDFCFAIIGKKRIRSESSPAHDSATIIIPNWNGRNLLRDFLPSVITAVAGREGNEIIVVDNASTDGSVAFVKQSFPQLRILELNENLGFGGACNLGVAAAANEVVVLLNNDMQVEPDFLPRLLDKFADPKVFAVASQIFFADKTKRREETGLTETWWQNGRLGVTHHVDPAIKEAFPCAYPGGGSSAFDKRKFIELGGFDELFHPFYYEDTDLGRLAWKRGWKVLYEPASVVRHNHRGTVGRRFEPEYVQRIIHRNAILYCWKNIHDWRLLGAHFGACIWSSMRADVKEDANWCSPTESVMACKQLRRVVASRWLSLSVSTISDKEAFSRPLGGYYRDRFLDTSLKPTSRLNVLFVSPYPIEPPVHGGAVFMKQAVHGLAAITNLHLISFVDNRRQLGPQEGLRRICKSVKFLVRRNVLLGDQWTLVPNGVREFEAREMQWAIHRAIYRHSIDVVQLDYTVLGQYAGQFERIPCMLFEHDISMQSLSRQILSGRWKINLLLEYVRMRIFEPRMLKKFCRVQVCSNGNKQFLRRAVRGLDHRIDADLRAGIDVDQYPYVREDREPDTLLFIGSFRHGPNVAALTWFTVEVLPRILAEKPNTMLVIVGSDPPVHSTVWNRHKNIRLLGSVPDVRDALQRYSLFICPILSGSGIRVKLLEAFASGIPCVSTTVGAEGLTRRSGDACEVADTAKEFGRSVLRLLESDERRSELAAKARDLVECEWNSRQKIVRLEEVYRNEVNRMRKCVASVQA